MRVPVRPRYAERTQALCALFNPALLDALLANELDFSFETEADFANLSLKPPDAILLASDLSQPSVSGALTSINLRENNLGTQGWRAIFNALRDNKENKIASWDLSSQSIDAEAAKAIAEYVAVSGTLTDLNLAFNKIGAQGAAALADART